jgi:hypothetical protein
MRPELGSRALVLNECIGDFSSIELGRRMAHRPGVAENVAFGTVESIRSRPFYPVDHQRIRWCFQALEF